MPLARLRLALLVRLNWLRRRALARGSEIGFVLLALLVGAIAGAIVSLVSLLTHFLQSLLYDVPFGAGLSGSALERDWTLVEVPILGGLMTALVMMMRRRSGRIVDPVEANALYGGRMSLTDSIWLTMQNLCSNGFGLSAGLEAAYTQCASGAASKLGLKLKLRREDMRVLVGCGSAGAIAAAFGAPMTGAFYAFELIIGTYSAVSLAPVIGAAITAMLVSHALSGSHFQIDVPPIGAITAADFAPAVLLGGICGLLGILVMIAVVRTERLASASPIPEFLRPAVGGLLVGLIGLVTPQVLSSGHGAMHLNLQDNVAWTALATLFLFKAAASALTIGWGFRGGLFFASLMLGALAGKAMALPLDWLGPGMLSPTALAVIGMGPLAPPWSAGR